MKLNRRIDTLLSRAFRATRLLSAVVPQGQPSEPTRMVADLLSGRPFAPRWTYESPSQDEVSPLLDAAAHELEALPRSALRELYDERLDELRMEYALTECLGSPSFGSLAQARFSYATKREQRDAALLAREWLALPPAPRSGPALRGDAGAPEAMFARMREEVGRLRLPVRVLLEPSLNALAATGDGVIFVAPHRLADRDDVERTVLHEIMAHALPRVRASRLSPGIFALGTARGIDEQEGLALVYEERFGHLRSRRKRELGARHMAVVWMQEGASFREVATTLVEEGDFDAEEALRVTMRAFRGSDGTQKGLGRERVYLEAYLRVKALLEEDPGSEQVLAAGQIATHAVSTLETHVHRGAS